MAGSKPVVLDLLKVSCHSQTAGILISIYRMVLSLPCLGTETESHAVWERLANGVVNSEAVFTVTDLQSFWKLMFHKSSNPSLDQ